MASGSTALQLNITGPTNPSNFFAKGIIQFTSGVNSGQQISVRAFVAGSPNVVLLYQAAQNTPGIGDTVTLFPGCDKQFSTCQQKFASSTSWVASHVYAIGDRVFDGTHTQYCTTPGTAGGSTPTWNASVGGATSDRLTAEWLNTGLGNELNYNGGTPFCPLHETAV